MNGQEAVAAVRRINALLAAVGDEMDTLEPNLENVPLLDERPQVVIHRMESAARDLGAASDSLLRLAGRLLADEALASNPSDQREASAALLAQDRARGL